MQASMTQMFRSPLPFFRQQFALILLRNCCILAAVVVGIFGGATLSAQESSSGVHVLLSPPPSQDRSADSLLQRLALASDDTMRVEILDSLAWMYRGSNYTKAIQYAQQAAREVLTLGYPPVRAQNSNYLGVIYRNLGNYAKAMEYFVEARKIAEKYGYRREEGYALNNIGDIYKYQRRYDDARTSVMLSIGIFKEIRDSAGLYYCHIRLGELAQSLNDFPAALQAFRQALSYAEPFAYDVWKSGALNRIGQVYRQQGAYAEALGAFFPALAISTAARNDDDEQAMILIQIGRTYFAAHRQDSAIYYLQRGFDLAERIGIKHDIREASKALAEIYLAKGDYATAYRFQSIQMAMSDSLFSEAGRREIERAAAKYELEKQQNALDTLSAEQKQERLVGLALVGGIALLLVIAVLLYRNARLEHRANIEIVRQQRILEDQSTEIELTNATLQEQNGELAALNTEKSELMGIVAHDLKNPIGAVRGLAELIESDAVQANDLQTTAHQIVVTSDRMLALVTNVLDMNRLELGGMKFHIVEFDILSVVEVMCEQYQQVAEAKQITVHYRPDVEAALAFADEQALMQVLDNLLSNAIKYSPHGKNVFVRVGHSSDENRPHPTDQSTNDQSTNDQSTNDYVRVEVRDEGSGLSAEDKTKLFGKFARLSAQPTGGEHSTGLGLSIVKKIVEAMQGRVWCESELGQGARFIVELPVANHTAPSTK